jgi:Flp pilus assembly protein TadD
MGWLRKTARDYLLEGTGQSMRGEYERAIVMLSKAIDLDPQYAEAYMNRGIAYLESGQVEKALQDFSESLRLEPNALCYYNRAQAWLAKQDLERAAADLNEAVRLAPEDAETYNMRAIVLSEQESYERGLADIERAIELGHRSGLQNKAVILEMAGRGEEAVACWDQVLKIKPKDTMALCRRGLLLERAGRKEQARQDLQRAWKERRVLGKPWQTEVHRALERLKE